jgi:hypothetical protein
VRIQVRRFPIACAMGLQVHRVQNTAHGARTDRRYMPSTTASRARS